MSIKTKEKLMKKNIRLLAIFAAVVLLGLYAAARPAGEDTAKDPVCGMSVKIAGAAQTAEYSGKTYYFFSESCKTAFLKEPAKFAPKEAAAAPATAAKKCPGTGGHDECEMTCAKATPGQAPATPAPCAPPAPPVPPAAVAPGAATPECTRMKDAPKPCCAMTGHEGMRMKMMHGMPMKPGMTGHGMAGGCPICGGMAGKAEIAVENTKDGAVVRITSKDPEAVKMIQEHLAKMKAACDPATCPEAKKGEEKKEK
jgi:YHS domain-containing protein